MLLAVLGLLCTLPLPAAEPDPALKAVETLYRQDGPEVALPKFEQLAERFKAENQKSDEAMALHFIGECHWRLGDFDKSREYLDIALEMRTQLNDRLGQGKTLNVLGLQSVPVPPVSTKRKMCSFWMVDKCTKGSKCPDGHECCFCDKIDEHGPLGCVKVT